MDLLELLGDEIVVTPPGTDFMTAYRTRPDSPTLKLTRSWVPHTTSPAVSEFRAAAFHKRQQGARARICGGLASPKPVCPSFTTEWQAGPARAAQHLKPARSGRPWHAWS